MVKRSKYIFTIIIILVFAHVSFSQRALTLMEFVKNVKENHPYVNIANNKLSIYKEKLTASRGLFDPKVKGSWSVKNYDGKEYFNIGEAKLVAPTRLAFSPVIKYTNNSGYYLNPENTVPPNGLVGAGIEIPLLQGLIIDENRTQLKQSKLAYDGQLFSNDSTLNAILFMAIEKYIDWQTAYNQFQVMNQLVEIRQQRFENVYNAYLGGSLAAMDTLDALAQLQKAQRDMMQIETVYIKAKYELKNQVWDSAISVLDLIPESAANSLAYLESSTNTIDIEKHNFIQSLNLKKEKQKVQVQYQKELFKPTVDLGFMPLASPTSNPDFINSFSTANYLLSLNVEIPLWYRKQTSYFRISKLEMENIDYKLQIKRREIQNKFQTIIEVEQLQKQQYNISTQNVDRLNTLKQLEEDKFNIGESTLLKVNIRENKLIDEQIKTLEVFKKYGLVLANKRLYLQELN